MDRKLEDQLKTDFPLRMQFLNTFKNDYPIAYGIELGDSAEPIIRKLCEELDKFEECAPFDWDPPVFIQIKDKFNEARIYSRGGNEATRYMIDLAEGALTKLIKAQYNVSN